MQSQYQLKTPETPQEFEEYYNVRYEVLRKPWNQPKGSEKDDLEEKSIHRMFVDENNKVVANARMHFNNDKEAQVRYLAVSETCRGAGLGTKLMEEMEKVAKEKGAEEMLVVSRETAIPFYLKNGYNVTKDSHTLFGEIKHKEMRKALA